MKIKKRELCMQNDFVFDTPVPSKSWVNPVIARISLHVRPKTDGDYLVLPSHPFSSHRCWLQVVSLARLKLSLLLCYLLFFFLSFLSSLLALVQPFFLTYSASFFLSFFLFATIPSLLFIPHSLPAFSHTHPAPNLTLITHFSALPLYSFTPSP